MELLPSPGHHSHISTSRNFTKKAFLFLARQHAWRCNQPPSIVQLIQNYSKNTYAFDHPSIIGVDALKIYLCGSLSSLHELKRGPFCRMWKLYVILGWFSLCTSVVKIHMIEMSGIRADSSRVASLVLLILVLVVASSRRVWCVDEDEYSKSGNPKVLPLVTSLIYNQILNLTKIFNKEITLTLGYCTQDVWVKSIYFVSNTIVFLSQFAQGLFAFPGMLIWMGHSNSATIWIFLVIVLKRQKVFPFNVLDSIMYINGRFVPINYANKWGVPLCCAR